MAASDRPRRSLLYMPSSNARALEKAKTLPVDGIIFDLEDAVAPDAKPAAREAAVAAAADTAYGRRERLIRINGLGTQWHDDDLAAVAQSAAAGVVVPKINSAEEIKRIAAGLDRAGAPAELAIWAMMETPRGILDADTIAQASPRLAGLMVGTADLAKDLGCAHPADRAPMLTALQLVIMAARANGLVPIDGVHVDLQDADGLALACRQGRDLGFDGKTLIHPNQIDAANTAFAPSADEIAYAERLIEAHKAAQAAGAGVTTLDGRLVEVLHVQQAEKLVKKAAAIAALEQDAA